MGLIGFRASGLGFGIRIVEGFVQGLGFRTQRLGQVGLGVAGKEYVFRCFRLLCRGKPS